MRKFSDFKIKPKSNRFVGDKIRMWDVLNRPIIVHEFKIDESKFKDSNSRQCLSLQIELNGQKRLLFTGSKVLTSMIEEVPKEDFTIE